MNMCHLWQKMLAGAGGLELCVLVPDLSIDGFPILAEFLFIMTKESCYD